MTMITDEMVERAAESDALFDGYKALSSMGRHNADRYRKRARAALTAALGDVVVAAWRYRFEPGLRWHVVDATNDIPARAAFPQLEVQTLYAALGYKLNGDEG